MRSLTPCRATWIAFPSSSLPVLREYRCVDVCEPRRRRAIRVDDGEVDEVGVGLRHDRGRGKERPRRPISEVCDSNYALADLGHSCELRLRLRKSLRLVIGVQIGDPAQDPGQVLPVEEDLRSRLVERLLSHAQDDRHCRHGHERKEDDPFSAKNHAQVIAQARAFDRSTFGVHPSPLQVLLFPTSHVAGFRRIPASRKNHRQVPPPGPMDLPLPGEVGR